MERLNAKHPSLSADASEVLTFYPLLRYLHRRFSLDSEAINKFDKFSSYQQFGVVSECVRSVFGMASEGEGTEGREWEGIGIEHKGLKEWSDGGAGKAKGRRRGMEDGGM